MTLTLSVGKSWACGMLRIFDMGAVIVSLSIQAYLIFIVWSCCEDFSEAGGARLGDLAGEAAMARKRKMEDPYAAFDNYAAEIGGFGAVDVDYVKPQWLGGSARIFGNSHEMQYPP